MSALDRRLWSATSDAVIRDRRERGKQTARLKRRQEARLRRNRERGERFR